ncbi:redoxin domain-containing protein [Neolewinella antarctica]|uniref:Peroxiredoxin n=1 Tax=Neolewinella antarctica TaxID=442734 RepID=A0ABX0X6L6_9BACT|nr:thioredoxin-like domain-containing protein [Neolewinella antarctica]NJC24856.1 peroxiredoxin [Neolewinella antarctica]
MRLSACFLLLTLFFSCGDTGTALNPSAGDGVNDGSLDNAESPDIRLTITNVPTAGALLIGQYMDQQFRVDSARVEGNTVIFQRDEPYPIGHYYVYFTNGEAVQLLISKDQTLTATADMGNLVGSMKVDGSEDNELFYQALADESDLQPEFKALATRRAELRNGSAEYVAMRGERAALVEKRSSHLQSLFDRAPNSLFAAYKKAGQNPDLKTIYTATGDLDEAAQVADFRLHFWDNVNFSDDRLLRTPVIKNKLRRYVTELTPQNADSINLAADRLLAKTDYVGKFYEFFANWIALQYEPGNSTIMDAEAIHVHLIQNYFTPERATWSDSMTIYGLQQRAETMAYSLVGQQAPDITVPGLDGRGERLYDLEKPYVAVFMYNPECHHCVEEAPKLTALYDDLKDEVDFYAIALDTDDDKWEDFVRTQNFTPFTNVFDPTNRAIFKTFYVDNTPELYLLGPNRKIVAKNLKVSQLLDAIELHKIQ